MPLKNKILLWVTTAFLLTITIVFSIAYFETEHNLHKIDGKINKTIEGFDDQRFENLKKYLSININDCSEKLYQAFETLRIESQWRERFLPNEFNIRTNSWGSSAAFLSTFSELDLINVSINNHASSYIHYSRPYVRRYVKVAYNEELTLFCKKEGESYKVFIGVPFWSNKEISKHLKSNQFKGFLEGYNKSNWLLYEVNDLLELNPEKMKEKNLKIFTHLLDAAITIHSKEEFKFLVTSTKKMLEVTKNALLKEKRLIAILESKEKTKQFFQKAMNRIDPELTYRQKYCRGPLCDYSDQIRQKETARSDFIDFSTQRELSWKLCMVTRTGLWGFSPLSKEAPSGIVTSILQPGDNPKEFYEDIVDGFESKDVFLNKNANITRGCSLAKDSPPYDRSKLFKDKENRQLTSCRNQKLVLLYSRELNQPFLSSSYFISYLDKKNKETNRASITLGISLDTILSNLALASPNDVLFISKDNDIRYYQGLSSKNIPNTDDFDRETILKNKEGILTSKEGEKIFFRRIAQITKDNGYIVLIETIASRSETISIISNLIRIVAKDAAIHSGVLIIVAMITLIIVLSKLLNKITHPIKKLARLTSKINDRDISNLKIDDPKSFSTYEIKLLYGSFFTMVENMKEATKVRGLLDKVVSKEVVKKILSGEIKLGGEIKHITVMFCDIRNFTQITEHMHPKDVLIMLNECLTLLSGVIDNFEGIIDKYEGDKIMTLFGAPIEIEKHALEASLCALEMQKSLSIWNKNRKENGFIELHLGIGIHTGEAVAGNVGALNHLSYTVLGHIVNLCSRLCDTAEGDEILISEVTYNDIKEHFECRKNPAQNFKGISVPVVTYSIIKRKH